MPHEKTKMESRTHKSGTETHKILYTLKDFLNLNRLHDNVIIPHMKISSVTKRYTTSQFYSKLVCITY